MADSRVEAFPGLDVDVSDLDVIGGADAGVGVHLSDLGAAVVGGDDGWIILLRLFLSLEISRGCKWDAMRLFILSRSSVC